MAKETERTLTHCRRLGWTVAKAEHWQPSFLVSEIIETAASTVAVPEDRGHKARLRDLLVKHKRNPGVRKDLFGFIDVVALTQEGILGIQSTSRSNVGGRMLKIRTECVDQAAAWIQSGGRIEVWGWYKQKIQGERRLWHVKRRVVDESDVVVTPPF